jgi:hypothetical protein
MSCDLTSSWIRTLQRALPLTASVGWMGRVGKQRATAPTSGGQTVFESSRGRGWGMGADCGGVAGCWVVMVSCKGLDWRSGLIPDWPFFIIYVWHGRAADYRGSGYGLRTKKKKA